MTAPVGPRWMDNAHHHRWLREEQSRLVSFHVQHALSEAVGYAPLDAHGVPEQSAPRELWLTCRMIHSFALEHMLARPGAAEIAIHGIRTLDTWFHDAEYGGWFAAIAPDGTPADTTKGAYGHAFVILAGASATLAGLPGGRALLETALTVVDERLWRDSEGAVVDGCNRDWRVREPKYRGQNANMHLVEAYLAASEALDEPAHAERALQIAELIVNEHGRAMHWRVPEHFTGEWEVDREFNRDKPHDPFRPYGSLIGHWFEWARLVLQLDAHLPGRVPWAKDAATHLFARGIADGCDERKHGVIYSVDFGGNPLNDDRLHWVLAEGIGAAVALFRATDDTVYERWYRRLWDDIAAHHIDLCGGSWWHQLDATGSPKQDTWAGKPDLYHAHGATLYARAPRGTSLIAAAVEGLVL